MRESGRFGIGRIASVALIFIVLGAGLCVFGFLQGGSFDRDISIAGLHLNVGFNGIGFTKNGFIGDSENLSGMADYYEEFKSLERLEINVGVCDIKIIPSNKIFLEGSNIKNNDFTIDYRNGKLTIKQKDKSHILSLGENNTAKLTLAIPSDVTLDDVSVKNGVGTFSANGLNADKIDINVGVGSVLINGIYADRVKIDGGVGSVTASDLNIERLDINGGVGKNDISGRIDGNITIDGGVGTTRLELLNSEDEFDWDIDSGLGSITLNGKRLAKDYRSRTDSGDYKIKISSGVGNIDIRTE